MSNPNGNADMSHYTDERLDRTIDSVPGIILEIELDELAGGKPFEEIAAESAELAESFSDDE